MRPAKTQISLGIRPVWSESLLCAQWVAKDPSFLHGDSEDSDQTGQMPRLIWVFAGGTLILLVLSCRSSFLKAVSTLETVSARTKCNTCIITYNKLFNTLMNWLMCCAVRNAKTTPFLPKYWVTKESALSILNATGLYADFWKGGANLRVFTKAVRILRKFWFWGQNYGCKLSFWWKTAWFWNNLPARGMRTHYCTPTPPPHHIWSLKLVSNKSEHLSDTDIVKVEQRRMEIVKQKKNHTVILCPPTNMPTYQPWHSTHFTTYPYC